MIEQTLVLIKPDAMQKNLEGEIISELYRTGLDLVGIKIIEVPQELVEKHYEEHKGKDFFDKLVKHLTGYFHVKKVLAMVWEGDNAIKKIRDAAGSTNPLKADPKSIRGKFGRIHTETDVFENVIHASDSLASAEREIKLWFSPDELLHTIYPVSKQINKIEHSVWS